ncbi:MAG: branched-chain amino acid ABC transporter permease [Lachnospiraceae bacterium]|jgi:branched-chain amino acid transport system permease protein|nr:branched-chain amino acid ABC transporter permease [Lachnospiraceae bacterium]
MKDMGLRKRAVALLDCSLVRFVLFVAVPFLFLVFCGLHPKSYVTGLVSTVGIYIVLASSLNLINGFSGMFSMGHAAFMAIGAYISAFLTLSESVKANECPALPDWLIHTQAPFAVALVAAGAAAALVAVLVSFTIIHTKGHYLSVVTLALIVVIRALIDNNDSITRGSRGLNGIQPLSTIPAVYLVVVVTLFVLYRTIRSAYGRGLISMRDDPVAAQTLGVNLTAKKISSFAISAFFAGLGGALWAHYLTAISGANFYFEKSFDIVEISIIGGMFSLSGAVLGAIFCTVLPEFFAPLENGLHIAGFRLPTFFGLSNIIMAALLVLLIIFHRQGIMGYSEIIVESWFSKETYTALFKKSEYGKVRSALAALFRGT